MFLAILVILSEAKNLVPFEGHEILRFAQNDRVRQDFLPDPLAVQLLEFRRGIIMGWGR